MNKIWIKEIFADRYDECVPVDWTMDESKKDLQFGEYNEYSLDEGAKVVIDAFDNYEYLGVFTTLKGFLESLLGFMEEEDVKNIGNIDCFNEGRPHAYFLQVFDDEVTVHEFSEFNDLLGFNFNLYLEDILRKEHGWMSEWKKMCWLLNISRGSDEEDSIIHLEMGGCSVDDLISPRFFCCLGFRD